MTNSEVSVSHSSVSEDGHEEVRLSFSSVSTRVMRGCDRKVSTRKSINGLVIEVNWDDEEDAALWETCEDYENCYEDEATVGNPLNDDDCQEEFRAKLEAVEIEEHNYAVPFCADEFDNCLQKKLLEALEDSLSTLPTFEGETTGSSNVSSDYAVSRSSIRKSFNGLVVEYGDLDDADSDIDSVGSQDHQ